MKELRHAPAAPSVEDERMPSGTGPPWSAHNSTARAIHASSEWSADSKPTNNSEEPSVTPAEPASPGSSTRQFVGKSPDCETARHASTAASKDGKRTLAVARCTGRSCTR